MTCPKTTETPEAIAAAVLAEAGARPPHGYMTTLALVMASGYGLEPSLEPGACIEGKDMLVNINATPPERERLVAEALGGAS